MDPVGALVAGVVAGFAIALPLGPIAVLLVTEGIHNGHRRAAAGALGVASIDLVYAALAVIAGSAVTSVFAGREQAIGLVAAAILLVIGVRGLLLALRKPSSIDVAEVPATGGHHGTYWRFVALTALNPPTALYFVALAATLAPRIGSGIVLALFPVGVFVGSAAWQLALAFGGSALGSRLGPGVRRTTAVIGNAIVIALAVVLAVGATRA